MPNRILIIGFALLLSSLVFPLSLLAQTPKPRIVASQAGAVGDGITLNTQALQTIIDDLSAKGGGTLVIPPGKFLSGAIFLKPDVNLHLEKDATLLGSPNINDYPPLPTRIEGHTQIWRPALLNANKCDNLQIDGPGTIQGGGKPYWTDFLTRYKENPKTKNLDVDRPRNIYISDSNNVVIRSISLRDSGFWNLHLYRCQNLTVEYADIRSPNGAPSTDGIDIDSCQNVTINGCYISVDDDNIALKGTKGPLADQDTDSPPVEKIHILNCTFAAGHGVVTLGSEACHIKGVLVENCKVEADPAFPRTRNTLVRFKLRTDTPQHYEDIHFRNITLTYVGNLLSIEPWTQYFDLQGKPQPTQLVENIIIENITGTANAFGRITGPPTSTIRNLSLTNINLKTNTTQTTIQNVQNLKIQNVKLNGEIIATPQ